LTGVVAGTAPRVTDAWAGTALDASHKAAIEAASALPLYTAGRLPGRRNPGNLTRFR
jgi:hypothetical protein